MACLGELRSRTDPNSVVRQSSYDGFGREIETRLKPLLGNMVVVSRTEHHRAQPGGAGTWLPAWRRVWTYDVGGQPTAQNTAGVPVDEQIEVLDGFGHVRQTWRRATDGAGYVVEETLTDVLGHERMVLVPHTEPAWYEDVAVTSGSTVQTYREYDGLGAVRVEENRRGSETGCVKRTYAPRPWQTVTLDESGRSRGESYDAFGRLVEVKEGAVVPGGEQCAGAGQVSLPYVAPTAVTGRYAYDGLGLMQRFEDGLGNVWWYAHDRGRRPWQVERQAPGAARSVWYTVAFDQHLPVSRYEGVAGTGTEVVRWSYNDLGRLTQKEVRRQFGVWDTSTWLWDTSWKGAKTREVTPSATTLWSFQVEAGLGKRGLPTLATRTFTGTGVSATLGWTYDLSGRVRTVSRPGQGDPCQFGQSDPWIGVIVADVIRTVPGHDRHALMCGSRRRPCRHSGSGKVIGMPPS